MRWISSPRPLSTIFVDQRFALVLFKRVPILTNHGIHLFSLILQGFSSKIAPENATPAEGLSRGNIGQIEPGAKDGSRFETNMAPEGRFRGQGKKYEIYHANKEYGSRFWSAFCSDPWI